MIILVLGLIDLLTGILFFINNSYNDSHWLPVKIVLFFAFLLLIKGIIFILSADIASLLDIICAAVIIITAYFNIHAGGVIAGVICVYLIFKGIMSLLGA